VDSFPAVAVAGPAAVAAVAEPVAGLAAAAASAEHIAAAAELLACCSVNVTVSLSYHPLLGSQCGAGLQGVRG
jgi:hypothetical protein